MTELASPTRPELTLPDTEAAVLRKAYEDASVILEYGSGGSTALAAELPGKRVFSVESDKAWAKGMRAWFDAHPPADGTEVDIFWSNIGPTKQWGYPKTDESWQRYARYPLEIWSTPEFRQPDVVFVDGRFRAGCALAAAFHTQKPISVLVDDYARRKQYHRIETYIGAPEMFGRLARFVVHPTPIRADRLLEIIKMMTHP